MIGKKDSNCIFEQYCGIIKEQSDDLLTQVKKSALDPKVKQQLIALLTDPAVAAKWKGGDADTVNPANPKFGRELSTAKYGSPDQDTANAPDSNFAREMEAARKAQEDAYSESEVEKFLGEEEEEGGYADPASFFGGSTTPISQMGPMKFEPRVTPKVKTPQEKSEEEVYWAARQEVNRERKQAAIDQANANRKKITHTSSSEAKRTGEGVHPMINRKITDPDYQEKKQQWLAGISSVGGNM